MKIVKALKSISDFFWPLLEPVDNKEVPLLKVEDCNFMDPEIEFELKCINEYQESENNRRKEVESKAIIFIGSFGVATTILINLAKEIILGSTTNNSPINMLIVVMIFMTIIYLCRAIHFAIQTLKKRNYYSVGFPEYMFLNNANKKTQMFITKYNCVIRNRNEINIKVDYMNMAQIYFTRAIVVVLGLTITLLTEFIIRNSQIWRNLKSIVKQCTINQAILVVNGVILVILMLLIFVLFYRIRKFEIRSKK